MFTTPAPAAPTSVSPTTVSSASTSQPRPSSSRLLSGLRQVYHTHHARHGQATAHGTSARAARDPAPEAAPAPAKSSSQQPQDAAATPPAPSVAATASSPSLSRTVTAPEPSALRPSAGTRSQSSTMTRTRAETATQLTVRNHAGPTPASTPPNTSMDGAEGHADSLTNGKHFRPSIRFIPHQDPRAGRPSLTFPPVTRTLPDEDAVVRVGRYSERDNIPEIPSNVPSAAAVGFKSKVVSRKHCELWCKDSQWYIKDVKSSSGTFLNHIRLSQPNIESKPFKLKDGDIIQLGIDFRGGEEMIFRCVKIRVECNRGWQQGLNNFNKQTHQRLRNLAKTKKDNSDGASTHTSECSICLMSIAPCQSLFVAPCSHVWHYKCIRPILNGPTWPNFLCPNCRAVTDLEADVDDVVEFEEWDDEIAEALGKEAEVANEDRHTTPRDSTVPAINAPDSATQTNGQMNLGDLEAAIANISITDSITDSLNGIANQPPPNSLTPPRRISPGPPSSVTQTVTQPLAINITGNSEHSGLSPLHRTGSGSLLPMDGHELPMTPRNDAGPFVLDGSAGRGSTRSRNDATPEGTIASVLPPIV